MRRCYLVWAGAAALVVVPFVVRPTGAQELVCPADTVERGRPTLRGIERWCELPGEGPSRRHGPSIELDGEGNLLARGHYVDGHRHGVFETWSSDGSLLDRDQYWHEVPGHAVEDEDGICPPGATLVEYRSDDDRPEGSFYHLTCFVLDSEGNPRNEGPSLAFDRTGDGRPYLKFSHPLRNGVVDGSVRRWRPDGSLAREVTYVEGAKTGPARSWYESGALRFHHEFVDGRLHGATVFFEPHGAVRWHAIYSEGELVELSGDLALDGVPCPEGAAPVTGADEASTWCQKHNGRKPLRHGPFVEFDANGNLRARGRYRNGKKVEITAANFAPSETIREDAGRLVARATVRFDGSPLSAASSTEPDFWFTRRPSGARVRPTTEWDGVVGEIYGLTPGEYRVTVAVDDPQNEWAFPGDMAGSSFFVVKSEGVTAVEIEVEQILRLRQPFDTVSPVPGEECDLPPLGRSATFSWDGMGQGVDYEYRVRRYQCEPFRLVGVVAQGVTAEPRVTLTLPTSKKGDFYAFSLKAYRGERPVGHLVVHDQRGYGWSLRFRVPAEE